jgi:putative DNA primase/helicase
VILPEEERGATTTRARHDEAIRRIYAVPLDLNKAKPSDAAGYYAAALRWRVFPLWWTDGGACACPKGAACPDAGKHPIPSCAPHGFKDATSDPAVVREWWQRYPRANIGVATGGRSGVGVLDVDTPNPEKGKTDDGYETLAYLEDEHERLPDTPWAVTGRSGQHLWFRHLEGMRGSQGNQPGLDVRADDGYVVVAPSVHANGNRYVWPDGQQPTPTTTFAPWPAWLVDALKAKAPAVAPVPRTLPPTNDGNVVARARNYIARIHAIPGQRGHTSTLIAARALVVGFNLDTETAYSLLAEWNATNTGGQPWNERDLRHKIDSAAKNTRGKRWGWLIEEHEAKRSGRNRSRTTRPSSSRSSPIVKASDGAPDPATLEHDLTDLGNARRFVRHHGENIRYVPGLGRLAWDGTRWKRDDDGAWVRYATQTADAIWEEAKDNRTKDAVKVLQHAVKSRGRASLDNATTLAESDARVIARVGDLDADPWLFNVTNGTVDLRTGTLLEHDRRHLISKIAATRYDPSVRCHRWLAFLERVQPNPDVRAWLKRWAGFVLTGHREAILPVFFGKGANGKSTFTETIRGAMGEYAATAATETFLARNENGNGYDLAGLVGVRMVLASETPDGARLNEVLVKSLTGGESLRVCLKYEDFFEYAPVLKPVISTNHRPVVRGTDDGIWRRLALVPWTVTIPESERNPNLLAELREEWPGILAWAVEGATEYAKDRRLPTPDAIREATRDYRDEEDALAPFLEERCVLNPDDPSLRARASDLFSAYQAWAKASGEPPQSTKWVGARLTEKGCSRTRSNGTRWWRGIALQAPTDEDQGS